MRSILMMRMKMMKTKDLKVCARLSRTVYCQHLTCLTLQSLAMKVH